MRPVPPTVRPVPARLRPTRPLAVLAALVVLAITSLASPAGAHSGDQTYLYLDVSATSVGGRIEAPIADLDTALGLGLDLGAGDEAVLAQLHDEAAAIDAYLTDHLRVGADGERWPVRFDQAELFYSDLPEADDNYVILPFSAAVTGDVPRVFDLELDPFFDEIEGRDALLLIGNDWKGGVIENGHEVFSTFNAGSRSQTVDLGDTSWLKNVVASGELGINHIRTGPDHVLFVLVLLLPSVLVFTSRWQPAPSFGAALWRVLKIVTMFTVAHTITFTLAGLGVLPLPGPRIVESVIAISIAAAALHNLRPLAANREWAIAFAFGLFHGMGFASLVEGLDVDRGTQLISLLGRNLGIEVGQAVVVLLLFPGLYLLRRTRYFQGFFAVASVVLAAISVGWMIERLFEVDLGVSGWVEPVVAWPRVLYGVLGFTLLTLALNRLEHQGGRLRPVADTASPADEAIAG